MAKEIKAFECGFCRKIYRSEIGVNRHEVACSKNPESDRACFHCRNLCYTTLHHFIDLPTGGEEDQKVKVLFCSELKSAVYPPKVELKGNAFEILYNETEEVVNQKMPKIGMCPKFHSYYNKP